MLLFYYVKQLLILVSLLAHFKYVSKQKNKLPS